MAEIENIEPPDPTDSDAMENFISKNRELAQAITDLMNAESGRTETTLKSNKASLQASSALSLLRDVVDDARRKGDEYADSLKSQMLNTTKMLDAVGKESKAYKEGDEALRKKIEAVQNYITDAKKARKESDDWAKIQKKLQKELRNTKDKIDDLASGISKSAKSIGGDFTKITTFFGAASASALTLNNAKNAVVSFNQSMFDMSRTFQVSGVGIKDLNSSFDSVSKHTSFSKKQFVDFANSVAQGYTGIAPTTTEIANLATVIQMQFGPNVQKAEEVMKGLLDTFGKFPPALGQLSRAKELMEKVKGGGEGAAAAEKELKILQTSLTLYASNSGASKKQRQEILKLTTATTSAQDEQLRTNKALANVEKNSADAILKYGQAIEPQIQSIAKNLESMTGIIKALPSGLFIALGAFQSIGAVMGSNISKQLNFADAVKQTTANMLDSRNAAIATGTATSKIGAGMAGGGGAADKLRGAIPAAIAKKSALGEARKVGSMSAALGIGATGNGVAGGGVAGKGFERSVSQSGRGFLKRTSDSIRLRMSGLKGRLAFGKTAAQKKAAAEVRSSQKIIRMQEKAARKNAAIEAKMAPRGAGGSAGGAGAIAKRLVGQGAITALFAGFAGYQSGKSDYKGKGFTEAQSERAGKNRGTGSATGAMVGTLVGGAIGSVVPGIGTVIGGGIGGAIGGYGGSKLADMYTDKKVGKPPVKETDDTLDANKELFSVLGMQLDRWDAIKKTHEFNIELLSQQKNIMEAQANLMTEMLVVSANEGKKAYESMFSAIVAKTEEARGFMQSLAGERGKLLEGYAGMLNQKYEMDINVSPKSFKTITEFEGGVQTMINAFQSQHIKIQTEAIEMTSSGEPQEEINKKLKEAEGLTVILASLGQELNQGLKSRETLLSAIKEQAETTVRVAFSTLDAEMKLNSAMEGRLNIERDLMEAAHFGMGASISMMQKQVDLAYENIKAHQKFIQVQNQSVGNSMTELGFAKDLSKEQKERVNIVSQEGVQRVKGAKSAEQAQKMAREEAEKILVTAGKTEATENERATVQAILVRQAEEFHNRQKASMEQQKKIYDLTKDIREGYLDAVREMSFGAGEFEKIIGTQEMGVTQLMDSVKSMTGENKLNTMALGGITQAGGDSYEARTQITGKYTTSGAQFNLNQGQQESRNQDIYNFGNSIKAVQAMARGEGPGATAGLVSSQVGEQALGVEAMREGSELKPEHLVEGSKAGSYEGTYQGVVDAFKGMDFKDFNGGSASQVRQNRTDMFGTNVGTVGGRSPGQDNRTMGSANAMTAFSAAMSQVSDGQTPARTNVQPHRAPGTLPTPPEMAKNNMGDAPEAQFANPESVQDYLVAVKEIMHHNDTIAKQINANAMLTKGVSKEERKKLSVIEEQGRSYVGQSNSSQELAQRAMIASKQMTKHISDQNGKSKRREAIEKNLVEYGQKQMSNSNSMTKAMGGKVAESVSRNATGTTYYGADVSSFVGRAPGAKVGRESEAKFETPFTNAEKASKVNMNSPLSALDKAKARSSNDIEELQASVNNYSANEEEYVRVFSNSLKEQLSSEKDSKAREVLQKKIDSAKDSLKPSTKESVGKSSSKNLTVEERDLVQGMSTFEKLKEVRSEIDNFEDKRVDILNTMYDSLTTRISESSDENKTRDLEVTLGKAADKLDKFGGDGAGLKRVKRTTNIAASKVLEQFKDDNQGLKSATYDLVKKIQRTSGDNFQQAMQEVYKTYGAGKGGADRMKIIAESIEEAEKLDRAQQRKDLKASNNFDEFTTTEEMTSYKDQMKALKTAPDKLSELHRGAKTAASEVASSKSKSRGEDETSQFRKSVQAYSGQDKGYDMKSKDANKDIIQKGIEIFSGSEFIKSKTADLGISSSNEEINAVVADILPFITSAVENSGIAGDKVGQMSRSISQRLVNTNITQKKQDKQEKKKSKSKSSQKKMGVMGRRGEEISELKNDTFGKLSYSKQFKAEEMQKRFGGGDMDVDDINDLLAGGEDANKVFFATAIQGLIKNDKLSGEQIEEQMDVIRAAGALNQEKSMKKLKLDPKPKIKMRKAPTPPAEKLERAKFKESEDKAKRKTVKSMEAEEKRLQSIKNEESKKLKSSEQNVDTVKEQEAKRLADFEEEVKSSNKVKNGIRMFAAPGTGKDARDNIFATAGDDSVVDGLITEKQFQEQSKTKRGALIASGERRVREAERKRDELKASGEKRIKEEESKSKKAQGRIRLRESDRAQVAIDAEDTRISTELEVVSNNAFESKNKKFTKKRKDSVNKHFDEKVEAERRNVQGYKDSLGKDADTGSGAEIMADAQKRADTNIQELEKKRVSALSREDKKEEARSDRRGQDPRRLKDKNKKTRDTNEKAVKRSYNKRINTIEETYDRKQSEIKEEDISEAEKIKKQESLNLAYTNAKTDAGEIKDSLMKAAEDRESVSNKKDEQVGFENKNERFTKKRKDAVNRHFDKKIETEKRNVQGYRESIDMQAADPRAGEKMIADAQQKAETNIQELEKQRDRALLEEDKKAASRDDRYSPEKREARRKAEVKTNYDKRMAKMKETYDKKSDKIEEEDISGAEKSKKQRKLNLSYAKARRKAGDEKDASLKSAPAKAPGEAPTPPVVKSPALEKLTKEEKAKAQALISQIGPDVKVGKGQTAAEAFHAKATGAITSGGVQGWMGTDEEVKEKMDTIDAAAKQFGIDQKAKKAGTSATAPKPTAGAVETGVDVQRQSKKPVGQIEAPAAAQAAFRSKEAMAAREQMGLGEVGGGEGGGGTAVVVVRLEEGLAAKVESAAGLSVRLQNL